ncbi:PREDICTED: protein no-on-transient A-like [Atta colombica]|uniref:protein no-on-transient A-like n=1 Tax=Atta colombica TaxID=520822 RepID=UPI00084BCCC1|nr:PREDICTED: protein no-on-transient A-like [Atta colombica]
MIKLFLITLLCVAMFADSQEDQMNEMGTELRKARAEHAMMGQDSPLLMQANVARNRGGLQGGNGQGPPGGQGGPPKGGPGNGQRPPELTQEGGLQRGGQDQGWGEVGSRGQ